jgi:signal transduction histidine kinase/HAMP domain-containing protein
MPPSDDTQTRKQAQKKPHGIARLLPRGIRWQMVLLIGLALLPMVGLIASIYHHRYISRHKSMLDGEMDVAYATACAFEAHLDGIHRQSMVAAKAITSEQPSTERIAGILRTMTEYPTVRNVSWTDQEGVVLASTLAELVGARLGERHFFRTISQGRTRTVGKLRQHGTITTSPIFGVATAVMDEDGRVLGAVVVGVEPQRLSEAFMTPPCRMAGGYTIFDADGTVVFRSPPREMTWDQRVQWKEDDPVLRAAMMHGHATSGVTTPQGGTQRWFSARAPIGETGWWAGSDRPVNEAMAPVRDAILRDAAISLGVCALVVLAALAMAGNIARPIRRLEEDSRHLGRGEMVEDHDPAAAREVNSLRREMVGMARELTDRAAALLVSETRYRTLFANMTEGFAVGEAIFDELGAPSSFRLLEMNNAFERQMGVPRLALGKPITQIMPKIDPELIIRYCGVASTGITITFEMYVPQTRRHFSGLCYRPSHGMFAVLYRDITSNRLAEEEVRRGREVLQQVVDNIPVLLVTWDGRLKRFTLNAHCQRVLGWTNADAADDLMGKVYPDPAYRAQVEQYMKSLEPGWREWESTAKDGSKVPIDWANIRLSDDRMIGIGVDLRERKQAEEALRRTNRDLEQFAYVASHDLQEPLRTVASFMNILAERYGDRLDDRARQYIKTAIESTARMRDLIRDLLDYAHANSDVPRLAPVEASASLSAAVSNLRGVIESSGAQIARDPLPKVQADPGQLTRVFQNLLSNAIRFRKPDQPPLVRVSAKRQGDRWVLSVKDNGIGMPPEAVERAFDVFHRPHPSHDYAGSGVLLAVCKRIVERHGGAMWVESAVGDGSDFRFTLAAA